MGEREVAAEGATIAVEESGEGTAVVGLHGLTASRQHGPVRARSLVREGRRVVLYDARGHGRSSAGARYGYDSLGSDLIAVLDALGIEGALLVGASMGAHTAIRVALDAPARVRGLVLVTPAYDPDGDPARIDVWDALARGLREGGIEGFVAAYEDAPAGERWRATVLRASRQRLATHDHLDAVADALEQVPRSRPFDSFASLARIRVPTLVVGSRDEPDPGHPLRIAETYASAIPGARLLVESPGDSPIAWQAGRLSREVAALAVA